MPGRARVIGGGWQSEQYEARPGTVDEALGKYVERLDMLRAMGRRGALSDMGRVQLAMFEEITEDLSNIVGTKPCGICDRASRKACRHYLAVRSPQEADALALLLRRGWTVHDKASESDSDGTLALAAS